MPLLAACAYLVAAHHLPLASPLRKGALAAWFWRCAVFPFLSFGGAARESVPAWVSLGRAGLGAALACVIVAPSLQASGPPAGAASAKLAALRQHPVYRADELVAEGPRRCVSRARECAPATRPGRGRSSPLEELEETSHEVHIPPDVSRFGTGS